MMRTATRYRCQDDTIHVFSMVIVRFRHSNDCKQVVSHDHYRCTTGDTAATWILFTYICRALQIGLSSRYCPLSNKADESYCMLCCSKHSHVAVYIDTDCSYYPSEMSYTHVSRITPPCNQPQRTWIAQRCAAPSRVGLVRTAVCRWVFGRWVRCWLSSSSFESHLL